MTTATTAPAAREGAVRRPEARGRGDHAGGGFGPPEARSRRPLAARGPRRRAARVALVAALALTGTAIAPDDAPAGTYTVESCTNGSVAGWAPFHFGLWTGWSHSCGLAGGGLQASLWTAAGSAAGWTFSAPPHTEIAGFRLTRSYALPANQPYGTAVVTTRTDPGSGFYASFANFGGAVAAGPEVQVGGGLRGQTTLSARLDCGGGSSCTGDSWLRVHAASIDLRDDAAPTLGGVAGPLLAAGAVKGTRTLAYSVRDTGGGVRGVQLLVDGVVVAADSPACTFALPVPCPLEASGELALNTTRLTEGEHEVKVVVVDATLANRAQHGPFVIRVDNLPPPVSTSPPRISGGVALQADDGTWTGANLTFERRWQRFEAGSWHDVAAGSVYTPTAEDAGHRLRFRVRATNAEGTGEAFSDPTARLPVAPPPPASTPTPTSTPVPAPAPVVAAGPPGPAPIRVARLSAAFASTGQTTVTLRWGERRKVTGALAGADGGALAGERVTITSRLRADGAVALPLGHVITDRAGRFTYLPPAGASRTLTFTRGGSVAAVTVHTVPRISLRVAKGRIVGRVSGAPPGIAKRVRLQALRGRTWRTFATTRLRATGRTFAHRPGRMPRRVRARVVAEPGWPFATGTSPSKRGK